MDYNGEDGKAIQNVLKTVQESENQNERMNKNVRTFKIDFKFYNLCLQLREISG
jgi:hypothetical protein